jgi:hypothetical protein
VGVTAVAGLTLLLIAPLRMAIGLRRLLAGEPPPQPLLLRRSKDDRIGGE